MSDNIYPHAYRDGEPIGKIEWTLAAGYHVAAIHNRRHKDLPHFEVYVTFEALEIIEGIQFTIASGKTGYGETFDEALANATTKILESCEKTREDYKRIALQPSAPPRLRGTTAGKGTEINLDLSILDGLELDL